MNDPTDWSSPPDFSVFEVEDPQLAKEIEKRWNAHRKLVSILRAWVAGCGDSKFSTEEEVHDLLRASAQILELLNAAPVGVARSAVTGTPNSPQRPAGDAPYQKALWWDWAVENGMIRDGDDGVSLIKSMVVTNPYWRRET